jgi:hypothetical protein
VSVRRMTHKDGGLCHLVIDDDFGSESSVCGIDTVTWKSPGEQGGSLPLCSICREEYERVKTIFEGRES